MFLRGLNIIVLPLVQPWLSVVLKSCGLLLQLSFLLVCSRIGPQTWHKPDAYLLNESRMQASGSCLGLTGENGWGPGQLGGSTGSEYSDSRSRHEQGLNRGQEELGQEEKWHYAHQVYQGARRAWVEELIWKKILELMVTMVKEKSKQLWPLKMLKWVCHNTKAVMYKIRQNGIYQTFYLQLISLVICKPENQIYTIYVCILVPSTEPGIHHRLIYSLLTRRVS